jgi:signal transduction histidine kinase
MSREIDFGAEVGAHLVGRTSELTGQWFSERFELSIARGDTWLPPTVLGRHIPGFVRALASCISGGAVTVGRLPTAHVVHDPAQALDELELLGQIVFTAVRGYAQGRTPEVPPSCVLAVVQRCHGCLASLTRRVLSEYFEESTRRAERAEERARELLASIDHELRNRLQLASLATEALCGHNGELDRERLLGRLRCTLQRLDALAGDIASVHAEGAGAFPVRRTELSILVEEVLEQVRIAAQHAGVTLQVTGHVPSLDVDAGRLELVLVNLLTNAIKYRDPDKSNPWVRVDVIAADRGAYRIDIADNGIGVEREHIARIFERTYQVDTRHRSGDGLGLYLARRALLQLGSALEVDSKPGHGSVFSFTLMVPDEESH